LRFTFEAREPIRIEGKLVRQNLQCDIAVQLAVAGAIHFAHAPGADQPEDFIGAKASAGLERHGPAGLYV
jgi:hypothetical protein